MLVPQIWKKARTTLRSNDQTNERTNDDDDHMEIGPLAKGRRQAQGEGKTTTVTEQTMIHLWQVRPHGSRPMVHRPGSEEVHRQ